MLIAGMPEAKAVAKVAAKAKARTKAMKQLVSDYPQLMAISLQLKAPGADPEAAKALCMRMPTKLVLCMIFRTQLRVVLPFSPRLTKQLASPVLPGRSVNIKLM